MQEPGNTNVIRTYSQYQESDKVIKDMNEIIAQESHETGMCYGVSKCAEIVF